MIILRVQEKLQKKSMKSTQEMECPSTAQENGAQAPVNAQRSLMRLGCGSVAEQLPSRKRTWAPRAAKWGREKKIEEE